MVKFTIWNKGLKVENTKFTRELNTYGFDENGFGEELLFPIRLNGPSGENQETNLATYLVKLMEFKKTNVKIQKIDDKEWFKNPFTIESELLIFFSNFFSVLFFTNFQFN